MNLIIGVQGVFSTGEATTHLQNFLTEEAQNCGLQVLSFSENPPGATISIPQDKKHDLRIALNIFAAETDIHWTLETE